MEIGCEKKFVRIKTMALCADVSRLSDVDKIITDTISRFCKIDTLINNAGIASAKRIIDIYNKGCFRNDQVKIKICNGYKNL